MYKRQTWTPASGVFENASVLMVAGGGGGSDSNGGGGGAGGLVYNSGVSLSGQKTIVVGAGGTKGVGWDSSGTFAEPGENTSFTGLETAIGGGAGTQYTNTPDSGTRRNGGSGGGAAGSSDSTLDSGGTGTSGQGKAGGGGIRYSGGGGGGAGGAGGDGVYGGNSGSGGVGLDYSSVFGTTYGDDGWFAGGGAGATAGTASGGKGGGGDGGGATGSSRMAAQAHTGGGGSGGNEASYPNSDGGSGVVIINNTTEAVSISNTPADSATFNLKYTVTGDSESRMPELSIVNGLDTHTWSKTSSFTDINGTEYDWMFIGEESHSSTTAATTVALPYTASVEVVTGSPNSGFTDRIWNGRGSSTDNSEQKNCTAVNGIVEIKGTYTSAIAPTYLLVSFTSGAKNDMNNGHLKTIDVIVSGKTYFSIDLGTTYGIAGALMANYPSDAGNQTLFAIKLPNKLIGIPELKFDGYNKLTLPVLEATFTAVRISDWDNSNSSKTTVTGGGDWPDATMTHHQVLQNGDKSYQYTYDSVNRDAAQLFTTVISGDWNNASHGQSVHSPMSFGYKFTEGKKTVSKMILTQPPGNSHTTGNVSIKYWDGSAMVSVNNQSPAAMSSESYNSSTTFTFDSVSSQYWQIDCYRGSSNSTSYTALHGWQLYSGRDPVSLSLIHI